jgi:hypothetical protein
MKKFLIYAFSLTLVFCFASCAKQDSEEKVERITEDIYIEEPVTFFGDSVVLGAISEIQKYMPEADIQARTNRTMADVAKLIPKTEIADIVVLAVATNDISEKDLNDVLGELKGKKFFLVNMYNPNADYMKSANEILANAADGKTVFLIDWASYVKGTGLKLATDNAHLTEESAKDYTLLIADAIKNS